MLGKMKPKTFTAEQLNAIKTESASQTTSNVIQKSADPENFPVFEIPVNSKLLVYVPNHTIVNEDGEEELRMDTPLIHSVIDGKRFKKIRCIRGLSEATGYSGRCPLCEGEDDPWALANEQIKEKCAQRGLDVNASDDEAVKTIKRECYSKRVIKAPEKFYTFPVVVIETDPNDIKKIIADENGIPRHKTYWYTISEKAYAKKWGTALESMEDEPSHPGGHMFILNYTYESKSGDYNKRDSARELAVLPKNIKSLQQFVELFDKETEEWDVAKAIETVYDNMYYEEEDIDDETKKLLSSTREKLAIYQNALANGGQNSAFQLQSAGFAGQLPVEDEDDTAGLPLVGETDED